MTGYSLRGLGQGPPPPQRRDSRSLHWKRPRSPTRGMDEGDGLLVNGELAEVLKLVHSVRTGLSDSMLQMHFVAVGFRNLVTVPPTTPSTARRWVLL